MKYIISFTISIMSSIFCFSQTQNKPKLVVGIVVDQMRADYLYKYAHQYGNEGFAKLLNEGFVAKNFHFNYTPTVTGAGHASIYTGTTPRYHGVIGNAWYSREAGEDINCVQDTDTFIIDSDDEGRSPKHILTTNLGDELKLSNNNQSYIVSISLKDRGAILPGGHMADEVYWLDKAKGNFTSSSYYMNALPRWVTDFNNKKLVDKYLDQKWNLLYPIEGYTNSIEDDNNFEAIVQGSTKVTFPYDLKKMASQTDKYAEVVNRSPFGNTLLTDLAIEALNQKTLGQDENPDLLLISYSSTDAVGHAYGVQSKEVNDVYVRLDLEIARLLKSLDEKVGKGNYSLFLTADHGGTENPNLLKEKNIPVGNIDGKKLLMDVEAFLKNELGEGDWITGYRNEQFYLNRTLIKSKNLELNNIQNLLVNFLLEQDGVVEAYSSYQLQQSVLSSAYGSKIQNGHHNKLSGDVKYLLYPNWFYGLKKGATHNSAYVYDSQVPLLLYGNGFKKGVSYAKYVIPDITPTISALLNINFPNGTTGKVIGEALKR